MNLQREAIKSEKQNFIRLLKHVKIAVSRRDSNKEGLAKLLQHVEEKMDDLYHLKVEVQSERREQEAELTKEKVDLKQIYNHATQHYQKQVELLSNQLTIQKESVAEWTKLVKMFKEENQKLVETSNTLRTQLYENMKERNDLKVDNESLQTKASTLILQLTNSREEASIYRKQVEQLQSYLKDVSFIKEQFESNRVA